MTEGEPDNDDPMLFEHSNYNVMQRMLDALGYELLAAGLFRLEINGKPVDAPFEILLMGKFGTNTIAIEAHHNTMEPIGAVIERLETDDTKAAQLFLKSWHFKNVRTITKT